MAGTDTGQTVVRRPRKRIWFAIRADIHGLEWWYEGRRGWTLRLEDAGRFKRFPMAVLALLRKAGLRPFDGMRAALLVESPKEWNPRGGDGHRGWRVYDPYAPDQDTERVIESLWRNVDAECVGP